MRLDKTGQTLDIYFLPPPDVLWNCNGTFTSVDGNLWVAGDYFVWGQFGLIELSVTGGELKKTSVVPCVVDINSGTRTLTWDGQSFWLAQDFSVYKIDPSGSILDSFIYPSTTPIIGLVSDGNFFWVSKGLITANSTIDVTDNHGKLLANFSLPGGSGALAWDGTYLSTLRSNWPNEGGIIYQYNISDAQSYAAQRHSAAMGMSALWEILRPDSPNGLPRSGEGRVQVINNTDRLLRISFEKYNYSMEIASGTSQIIKPPDNAFLAEVSGLSPIQGQYPFDQLIRYNYIWTFEISK